MKKIMTKETKTKTETEVEVEAEAVTTTTTKKKRKRKIQIHTLHISSVCSVCVFFECSGSSQFRITQRNCSDLEIQKTSDNSNLQRQIMGS